MKIKTTANSYGEVMSLPKYTHRKPRKPGMLFRLLLKAVAAADLKATDFKCTKKGMEKLGKNEPALYLMNHSSFIDLKIASEILFPRPFNIVCTSDGFVGKEWLMRRIGCIPTKKFIGDAVLVRDMLYSFDTLKCSVLMYPEASYSFDGTATRLPVGVGKCLKLLGVPVVMITTSGAYARDPLYNNLQLRDVKVSAEMEYLLSPAEIESMSGAEIEEVLEERFSFDYFRWQQDNGVKIDEPFRADLLNRVLYKCPHCMSEGMTQGKGVTLTCGKCGKSWTLTEYGYLKANDGETEFDHIPAWYSWERECVRQELENGTYRLDIPVTVRMMVDMRSIYEVGKGRLVHTADGFELTGCDGKLCFRQKPFASYSLYADYYWYELGDMICIGDSNALYYCFPEGTGDIVAKTRLATEELYRIKREKRSAVGV